MVKVAIKSGVGLISLDHPEKRNALSKAMVIALINALEYFKKKGIKVVILFAQKNDGNVWSAGHYIPELPQNNDDPLGYDDPLEQLLRSIQHFPGPVITQIHGSVWGGAVDLVMTSDIAIGDPTCSFAITPAKIGIPYNASGIGHFISRLGLNQAKEMFFTAEKIDAEQAEKWGIINHLVPEKELRKFALNMAIKITKLSPLAIAVIKEQFQILSNSRTVSADVFERIEGLRKRVWDSEDYREGLQAFKEKRSPNFKGK
jgi:methylmalonyl-CoA decarboxylase